MNEAQEAYIKETDQWINEAQRQYDIFMGSATEGGLRTISKEDAARASELCCQIAKARGLRTHW